jgi:hypothetical protein
VLVVYSFVLCFVLLIVITFKILYDHTLITLSINTATRQSSSSQSTPNRGFGGRGGGGSSTPRGGGGESDLFSDEDSDFDDNSSNGDDDDDDNSAMSLSDRLRNVTFTEAQTLPTWLVG